MGVTYFADFDFVKVENSFNTLTRATARKVASELQKNVKLFIPGGYGDAKGAWKGWESSGGNDGLQKSIVIGGDKRHQNYWEASVRVRRGSGAEVYAGIHETGGFIHANSSSGMSFHGLERNSGRSMGLIRRFTVYIRPKNYFKQGYEKTLAQLPQTLNEVELTKVVF